MNEDTVQQLQAELRKAVTGEVRFDDGSRALYSTDASNYRQIPIGVVVPRTKKDIIAAVALCQQFKAPVLCRGGGTSLAGQCCNVAVVIDMSKYYNRIIELDPHRKIARVEPGLVLDTLRNEAEKYHLTFGPDPSTHNHCTLGGMIGNNSCGVHSVMAGKTSENVLELEILTYDGIVMKVGPTSDEEFIRIIKEGGRKAEIYRKLKELQQKYSSLIEQKFPDIPRRVSGYNFPYLLEKKGFDIGKALVGSESTCVIVLEATLRLVYSPPARSLVVLGYPDVYSAGDHVTEILPFKPVGLEGMDDVLVSDMKKKHMHPQDVKLLPEGKGWLLVEFGGETKAESDAHARKMMDYLKTKHHHPDMKLYDDPPVETHLWKVRKSGLGATARVPNEPDTWEGWEDSSVPPEKLGEYLRRLRDLLNKYDYGCALYGHFGQGCVHTRIDFDMLTHDGIRKYRSFIHEAADLVLSLGGSLSGEHGDGQSRGELLPKMFGPQLMEAFREFKSIWDPEWRMNPGKVIEPYSAIQNLRLGPHYHPPPVETHFKFPGDDENSFAKATLRCVGVGECRKTEGGVMCPSYMVTKEEKHSTRGRARLLFEMLQKDVIGKNLWQDNAVKEALDLCLACKGCKGECPLKVDMATYKAEFLSHYYQDRLRPRSAYAFGLIYWWARLASHFPHVANFFTQTPGFSNIAKWIAGVAPKRKIPSFAPETFKRWFFRKDHSRGPKGKVILWVDTFNNHFYPPIAKSAVYVLEHLGYTIEVPKASLCCGRPLYDFGMLDLAKQMLVHILTQMRQEIEAGTPVIGLEPSCVSVFRDEMCNLFPSDVDAQRLKKQVFTLSEFISQRVKDYPFPPLNKKALLHGHCHDKSVLGFKHEEEILKKLNMDLHVPDSGCCGMAGSFGFEHGERYEVSIKAGERVLLPAVRELPQGTLIIADGFSCREQIMQTTGRKVWHLAEILEMSLKADEVSHV